MCMFWRTPPRATPRTFPPSRAGSEGHAQARYLPRSPRTHAGKQALDYFLGTAPPSLSLQFPAIIGVRPPTISQPLPRRAPGGGGGGGGGGAGGGGGGGWTPGSVDSTSSKRRPPIPVRGGSTVPSSPKRAARRRSLPPTTVTPAPSHGLATDASRPANGSSSNLPSARSRRTVRQPDLGCIARAGGSARCRGPSNPRATIEPVEHAMSAFSRSALPITSPSGALGALPGSALALVLASVLDVVCLTQRLAHSWPWRGGTENTSPRR